MVILTNLSRVAVPLISLLLVAVMYVPVFAITSIDHGNAHVTYALGTTFFLLCAGWMGFSGLKAPYRAELSAGGVTVRRLLGERVFASTSIAAWSFARPDAPPTQAPLDTNGLLMLKFVDGSKFRAEVTAEQSRQLIALLPVVPLLGRL
ncbi:MAG: hypothetical protein QM770_16405 [Tepidisphaeraceae bacterium]